MSVPDKGLFYTLERGQLIERIVREDEIQAAELTPPPGTRAYFRGRCVSKFAKSLYGASWTSVLFDAENGTIKKVPLMDPHRGTASFDRSVAQHRRHGRCLARSIESLTRCAVAELSARMKLPFLPNHDESSFFHFISTHHPDLGFRIRTGMMPGSPGDHGFGQGSSQCRHAHDRSGHQVPGRASLSPATVGRRKDFKSPTAGSRKCSRSTTNRPWPSPGLPDHASKWRNCFKRSWNTTRNWKGCRSRVRERPTNSARW